METSSMIQPNNFDNKNKQTEKFTQHKMMFFLFAFLSDARCDDGTQVHADLKQFFLAGFPEEHLLSHQ